MGIAVFQVLARLNLMNFHEPIPILKLANRTHHLVGRAEGAEGLESTDQFRGWKVFVVLNGAELLTLRGEYIITQEATVASL